jgi:hypothetical protein
VEDDMKLHHHIATIKKTKVCCLFPYNRIMGFIEVPTGQQKHKVPTDGCKSYFQK